MELLTLGKRLPDVRDGVPNGVNGRSTGPDAPITSARRRTNIRSVTERRGWYDTWQTRFYHGSAAKFFFGWKPR